MYSRVPNTRGVLLNGGGGQKFAKNGFLRYLPETSAFYTLRTEYAVYALYALSSEQNFA